MDKPGKMHMVTINGKTMFLRFEGKPVVTDWMLKTYWNIQPGYAIRIG